MSMSCGEISRLLHPQYLMYSTSFSLDIAPTVMGNAMWEAPYNSCSIVIGMDDFNFSSVFYEQNHIVCCSLILHI